MKWLLLIPVWIILFGCIKKNKGSDYLKYSKQDTIYTPISTMASNSACKSIQQGYKAKFGVVTSNFYKVNQFLVVDNDSIAILKPYYTQVEFSDCYPEKVDNNLLVVYNAKNNKTKIYDNLLFSDDRNVLHELRTNGKGFAIHSEQGNSSKLFTNVFIYKNNIDSIQLESWGFNQYSKTYKFKNFRLDKFQIKFIDSLQQKLNK